jgi:hypothetical protein
MSLNPINHYNPIIIPSYQNPTSATDPMDSNTTESSELNFYRLTRCITIFESSDLRGN